MRNLIKKAVVYGMLSAAGCQSMGQMGMGGQHQGLFYDPHAGMTQRQVVTPPNHLIEAPARMIQPSTLCLGFSGTATDVPIQEGYPYCLAPGGGRHDK